jgi:hypothetical protein
MVVVSIELWPKGNKEKARPLGVILISNDGTGDDRYGNYDIILSHAGKYIQKTITEKKPWKTSKVINHRKSLSPYHLVYKAIKNCLWPKRS